MKDRVPPIQLTTGGTDSGAIGATREIVYDLIFTPLEKEEWGVVG